MPVSLNTLNSECIGAPRRRVRDVLGLRCFSKIAPTVISAIAIYVVDLIDRPLTSSDRPYDSVRREGHPINLDPPVAR